MVRVTVSPGGLMIAGPLNTASVSVRSSSPSTTLSPQSGTLKVLLVWPGLKVRVPATGR
jgi:hypothetical protein